MTKKAFRPTPHRVQNSIKILAGTKTNATIRDLDENEDESKKQVKHIIGHVEKIDENKINGNGWYIKGNDGELYKCSCSSTLYQLPENKKKDGFLYPTEAVIVDVTINPVLKTNKITSINLEGDEKLDISKWTHGEAGTLVIAKPKAAMSISEGMISLDYSNNSQILASEEGISLSGENTYVNSSKTYISSSDGVFINNVNIYDTITSTAQKKVEENVENILYTSDKIDDIYIQQSQNIVQTSFENNIEVTNEERVIFDIKDQTYNPSRDQIYSLLSNSNEEEIFTIYKNGVATIKSKNATDNYNTDLYSTITWISNIYGYQNTLHIINPFSCKCCEDEYKEIVDYIDYCPKCGIFGVLQQKGDKIVCSSCKSNYCQSCGHYEGADGCNDRTNNLFELNYTKINTKVTACSLCEKEVQIPNNLIKTYIDYCPVCNKFNVLITKENEYEYNGENILYCTSCHSAFCSSCGTVKKNLLKPTLERIEVDSFTEKIINYNEYNIQNCKLFYITQNTNNEENEEDIW